MRTITIRRPSVDWHRIVARVSQGVLLVIVGWIAAELVFGIDQRRWGIWLDFTLYRDAAASWLAGQGFYRPYQLTGPYPMFTTPYPIMYPPLVLYLLIPFTVLPAALWWIIPCGIVAWSLWRLRPRWWAWPLLLALTLAPTSVDEILFGNPVIWAWAAGWLAVQFRWPGPLVLFKPTLAPFALVGIRSRGWWVVLAAGFLAAVPFGTSMWLDWWNATRNIQSPWLYLVRDWPLMAMPLVASLRPTEADPVEGRLRRRAGRAVVRVEPD